MSSFAPRPVLTPYHFEIAENGRGYWVAKDTEGLIGGVFRTQKDALRFALFEAAGDSACVQVFPANTSTHRTQGSGKQNRRQRRRNRGVRR
jgi:hypothetical protein